MQLSYTLHHAVRIRTNYWATLYKVGVLYFTTELVFDDWPSISQTAFIQVVTSQNSTSG